MSLNDAAADTRRHALYHDILLIGTMAVLAGCGIIYQYLLSHYAGRVIGLMEHAIFAMIGVMIVSMGVGAFLARTVRNPYTGFAWLELLIALIGSLSILMIAGAFALSRIFPEVIADTFGLPMALAPRGGLMSVLEWTAYAMPFVAGFALGAMIGMEIPFIARVREDVHGQKLLHNVGTIYGADYIGAGAGAAVFILFILTAPIQHAAVLTAAANLVFGLVFLLTYYRKIRFAGALLALHGVLALLLVVLFTYGQGWEKRLEDALYQDKVLLSVDTKYQHVTLTRYTVADRAIYTLFLNGHTQFTTDDEHIYHSMLVHPVMMASARQKNILLVGGGDGLALRDVLKWQPEAVTVLELDRTVVDLFSKPLVRDGRTVNAPLLAQNENSFADPRVDVIFGDAFNTADGLIEQGRRFDAIIVDLPDPSHPDLNKLYASQFYTKLRRLLAGDGAIGIQSTSPYHAKAAFLTVGATLEHAGFRHVDRYHQNVPSFGEWGWTIAVPHGRPPRARIGDFGELPFTPGWFTRDIALAGFVFGGKFYDGIEDVRPNRLGTHLMYTLHQQAWEQQSGVYTD